jgi:hypothetical protein
MRSLWLIGCEKACHPREENLVMSKGRLKNVYDTSWDWRQILMSARGNVLYIHLAIFWARIGWSIVVNFQNNCHQKSLFRCVLLFNQILWQSGCSINYSVLSQDNDRYVWLVLTSVRGRPSHTFCPYVTKKWAVYHRNRCTTCNIGQTIQPIITKPCYTKENITHFKLRQRKWKSNEELIQLSK